MIGYFDEDIRPLILILPKISGYVKKFEVINKFMSFRINDETLSEKYKSISTKIEGLKNIELNALPIYDDRYMKTKIRTYGDKIYTNFPGLNVPDDIECKSFTVISTDSLFVYENKYYLQVYFEKCARS